MFSSFLIKLFTYTHKHSNKKHTIFPKILSLCYKYDSSIVLYTITRIKDRQLWANDIKWTTFSVFQQAINRECSQMAELYPFSAKTNKQTKHRRSISIEYYVAMELNSMEWLVGAVDRLLWIKWIRSNRGAPMITVTHFWIYCSDARHQSIAWHFASRLSSSVIVAHSKVERT